MTLRACKAALVAAIALWFTLVAYNNVVDYPTNFEFVQHVLSMDTVPANNRLADRALVAPEVHHATYAAIIGWEMLTALVCWWGAINCFRSVRGTGEQFRRARKPAVVGLTLGLLLFLVGFLTVAAEWFAMWQSPQWNGQAAAFRMFAVIGLVLVFLTSSDE
jgi:predicted small integral membrane protein